MTYAETLEYLYKQLPMYQRIGHAAYKADLGNTNKLMQLLGHPYTSFPTIHVAGTNGKGSTSHLLASVLQESGFNVGLYTSPHLIDFRERIRVNGAMISEQSVVDFVENHRKDFESISLSFFEWSVGLAFEHFKNQKVDIAVVEVGMGGRLDSTNVITPILSVITNIGLDHTQYLGESLTQIAREKGGIIKPKVPVVIGQSHRETEGVFRKIALALDSSIVFADQQFPQMVPENPLGGDYQKENFQTVLIALEVLERHGWKIPKDAIQNGFFSVISNTGLRGRWEIIQQDPLVIADVAHNIDGLRSIVAQLNAFKWPKVHFVLGFVSDKEVGDILRLFPKIANYYLCQPNIPRAMPIERLKGLADQANIKYDSFETVQDAVHAAIGKAMKDDIVYVGGSTFVVADLLSMSATIK